jgi:predicted ester cyclase
MRNSNLLTDLTLSGLLLCLFIFAAGCNQPDPSVRLKPLAEKYLRAWNTGDFQGLEGVVSSQFELRMSPRFQPVHGLDSLKSTITLWRTAYPDFTIALDEVLYSKDAISCRWTIRATNSGPGAMPPTGKSVAVQGMSIIHVSAGKITDEWIYGNDLTWMLQLGFTVAPPSPGK